MILEKDAGAVGLSRLVEGEHFGEIYALFGMPATATVRAVSDLDVIFILREDLHTIMLKNPAIGYKLFGGFTRMLADRLARTNTLVGELN